MSTRSIVAMSSVAVIMIDVLVSDVSTDRRLLKRLDAAFWALFWLNVGMMLPH